MKLCCSIPLLVQIYQSDIQIRYALSVLVFTRIFTCTIGVYWDIYVYYWCVLGYLRVLLVCTGIFTCTIGVYWDIYVYYWRVLGYLPVLLVCTGISSTLVGISWYYLRHSKKLQLLLSSIHWNYRPSKIFENNGYSNYFSSRSCRENENWNFVFAKKWNTLIG